MLENHIGQDELRDTQAMPWVMVSDGIWFKLVKVLDGDAGWISLLRLRAGAVVGPHRHTGGVHGFLLRGRRQLMDGTICDPGTYVYEPPGNVDAWSAVGAEDLVSLFLVHGSVEYLSDDGEVTFRETAASKRASWDEFCRQHAGPSANSTVDLDAAVGDIER